MTGTGGTAVRMDSHAISSHGLSLEHTRSADLGKHSIFSHFPKDRNCEICQRTKMTRAPCRRRNGEAVPRADKFGDLITADHKVLSEGCESRNNHRYAVAAQDLATKTFQETERKEVTKVSRAVRKANSNFYRQFFGIWQSLRRIITESLYINASPTRDERYC